MDWTSKRPTRAELDRAKSFANAMVGKRYPREGESPDGPQTFNCWGLARRAAQDLHGWDLPTGPIDGLLDQVTEARLMRLWRRQGGPEHGAIGYTATTAAPRHVVVYLANDRGVILHALEGHGVVCWPARQLETYGFLKPVWYLPATAPQPAIVLPREAA